VAPREGPWAPPREQELLVAEEEAREAAGLSRDEVKDFRHIFLSFDTDSSGSMNYGELKGLLGGLVHIDEGSGTAGALRAALEAVDDDGNRELSFPEFLRLMKKLHADNWNGINSVGLNPRGSVSRRSMASLGQCLEEAQQEAAMSSPLARRRNTAKDWNKFIDFHRLASEGQ